MMASGDIKGFYREKKQPKGGGLAKSDTAASSSKKRKKKADNSGGGATLGALAPQTTALFAHGTLDLTNDYSEEEERLRNFDMDTRYGPCVGMTRLARWERAFSMGLQPPAELRDLQFRIAESKPSDLECLWEGRV